MTDRESVWPGRPSATRCCQVPSRRVADCLMNCHVRDLEQCYTRALRALTVVQELRAHVEREPGLVVNRRTVLDALNRTIRAFQGES